MNTKTIITITATNECPHCGTEKERITGLDAHQLNTWLKDTYGEAIATVATGYEQTNGGFVWEHGGHYDITDSDLLGGDGDGERNLKAREVFTFNYVDAVNKTQNACKYCAQYL